MNTFLYNVVQNILSNKTPLKDVVIVLPSKRSCIFLKQEFKQQLNKATFLPTIYSIESFVQELAELNALDTTHLLFEFYKVYKSVEAKSDSFDVFSEWARTLLQDFNDIDAYLIETDSFFATLKATSRLNNWFFEGQKPTALSQNYLSFFENIHNYYSSLYKHLLSQKVGYQGLIYREAVKKTNHYIHANKNTYFYFAGFNALNKAEENIFQSFLDSNNAQIFWDEVINPFGSNTFLDLYKRWPYYQQHTFTTFSQSNENQEITLIGAPKNVTQFKHVGELLEQLENYHSTAFVLANESLLPLALNALPNKVKQINITMGFPLEDAPLKSFFEQLFKLHLNQKKFQKTNKYYYKDVIKLLNHTYSNILFKEHSSIILQLINTIKNQNIYFLDYKSIKTAEFQNFETVSETLKLILQPSKTPNKFIQKCFLIINKLKTQLRGLEKEMLFQFYSVFLQLDNLNNTYQAFSNLKILAVFFKQLLQKESISFQGEPLEGLQLMGLLETRALDFETILLTSANEGILPTGKTTNSFIPFDVKKYYKIPTYHDKDTIFSYHFYRLIKRAKKIVLLYNTETDNFGNGEKSRFLTQLLLTNKINTHYNVSSKVVSKTIKLQEIHKNETVIIALKKYAIKGFSPSALASYIYDPLLFYKQKILGVNQTDKVEETIAANTLGNVIHDVLDTLYTPFVGMYLTPSNLLEMKEKAEDVMVQFFKKHYKNGDISAGKNRLIVEVAKSFILRFLNQEQKTIENGKTLKIIATELSLSTTINIDTLGFPVKLKGIIDRVDQLDGVTRIIDYKTGLVMPKQLKMNNFTLFRDNYDLTKAMQIMLYTFLYTQNHDFDFKNPLESGIISFKNFKAGLLKVDFGENRTKETLINQEHLTQFVESLKALILEIFDTKIPFKENENKIF